MSDPPPSAVAVTWAGGVATVTVHGGLDSLTCDQVRERIAELAGAGPQLLVLDLRGAGDRFAAESLALIAVARQLLPPGCVLDVRSASPAVRQILALAGWSGLEPGNDETESGGEDRLPLGSTTSGSSLYVRMHMQKLYAKSAAPPWTRW